MLKIVSDIAFIAVVVATALGMTYAWLKVVLLVARRANPHRGRHFIVLATTVLTGPIVGTLVGFTYLRLDRPSWLPSDKGLLVDPGSRGDG